MPFSDVQRAAWRMLFVPLLILAGCSSDGGTTGVDTPPTISVTGVADGVTYPGAVTITVDVDKGSYSATLDGAAFITGATVQAAGSHTLIVTAHQSGQTTTKTVRFTIQGAVATGGALIIRLIDLGPNDGAPGDAILLTDSTSGGKVHVLIDAGPSGFTRTDLSFVSRRLTALGVDTLSIMVLTHAHEDHFNGMGSVLTAQKVKRFIYSGQKRTLSSYTSTLALAQSRADSVIAISDSIPRSYTFGYSAQPTSFKVLLPLQTFINKDTSDGTELNEGSVGSRLDLGTFSMFFTGDSEVKATERWRISYPALTQNIKVLKVGHHGANNAIFDDGFGSTNKTSTWLDFTAPKTSVISGNGVSHPRLFALARLQSQPGNTTFCTNTHGTITIIVTRDGSYTVTPEKNATLACEKGSAATT